MTESDALARMVPPGKIRPSVWRGGVLQIHVTRACDKSCFGCTQGSNLGGKPTFISLKNFEKAVGSLQNYFGVVGVFGGNPAMHPEFEELCEILVRYIPLERRGLWCNNPRGHGPVMRRTFNPGVSNLNVHLDRAAYDEFKRDWPESMPFGLHGDSRHGPPYVAMQDVIENESEIWELIAGCDINQKWSAMIAEFRGELRGYFCEIAGAQAILHQHEPDYPDLGVPIVYDWWKRPMADFAPQVRHHCFACGIPLRGHGELAMAADDAGREQVSDSHAAVYKPKRPGRQVELVTLRTQLGDPLKVSTDYLQNAR